MFKPKIAPSIAGSILGGGMKPFGAGGMPKLGDMSGGAARPGFKFRVKPIAMASAFGNSKPAAFPQQQVGAYK